MESNHDEQILSQNDLEGVNPLMVHVTAPCDLQGGYTFEAILADGTPFICQVVSGSIVTLSSVVRGILF